MLLFLVIPLVSCGQSNLNESAEIELQPVTVQERTGDGYTTIKVIEDNNELKTIVDILNHAEWQENIKVEMERPPDYRFTLDGSTYSVWVTPNGDRLEIITEGAAIF